MDGEEISQKQKKKTIIQLSNQERDKILYEATAQNTRNATKRALKHLNAFIKVKNGGLDIDVEQIETSELLQLLYEFYTDAQYKECKDGEKAEKFKNTTMNSIRAGINRYLKEARGLDIMKDTRFTRSNQMFKAVKKINKGEGRGNVDHKKPISESDHAKLDKYFKNYLMGRSHQITSDGHRMDIG